MTADPLPPGSTIGILGGGQLGRMLAMAAARLGLRTHVYCPDPDSPAFDVAAARTVAAYTDETALTAFAAGCDAVTFEFENVPARTVEVLSARLPTRPGARSLAVCQDRLEEKRLCAALGIATADWLPVDDAEGARAAAATLARPAILKTRRLGYDGKGQACVDGPEAAEDAFAAIGGAVSVLEARVPFACEVSVIGVRAADGAFAAYDVTENEHEAGILRTSRVPARIGEETAAAARAIARRIADALGHVGVLGVEMFVLREGNCESLLVNEIAPRVHNTGHWTIEACPASQFEAHVRAVAGWPLPSTRRVADARMTNLIGADAEAWAELAAEPGAALHLYGKREARPGRKMGHVTRLGPTADPTRPLTVGEVDSA
ncbi:5-(carboxyamino)imidazole ribonucleotide synthase [Tepidamorphus gemmatus]|uniref:N5-carboxyaminoimidazole ribonucleotide synthase n=1 Tax=Tepidamorphus gemmatus TaxID=747076 RepID=A0A4R3MJ02_9HYPH|nr:5-(carboxyamino)imidazole ribonucleotide synthase [Tepidamorphus gemmatus]TCT13344.1 5-(carboxyamino)imidazole ribonucleotide synthase [Tepidamorphus gemmatus]